MSILIVERNVTLDKIKAEMLQRELDGGKDLRIFYGSHTCWWSHDAADLSKSPGPISIPVDSRGGTLFEAHDWRKFLETAASSEGHYGRHGLTAFLMAHHKNSFACEPPDPKPSRHYCESDWGAYNDAIDRAFDEGRLERVLRIESGELRFAEMSCYAVQTRETPESPAMTIIKGPGTYRFGIDGKVTRVLRPGSVESEITSALAEIGVGPCVTVVDHA